MSYLDTKLMETGKLKIVPEPVEAEIPEEFKETIPLLPMLTLPSPPPPVTRNNFAALTDLDGTDSDDDGDEVMRAQSQISSKVIKGRTSQRTKKPSRKPTLDTAHLNNVAKQVKNG